MRVQFEYTIDEQVDTIFESTVSSPRARLRMQRDRLTTALSAGAIVFLFFPQGAPLRPWIALAAAAVWAIVFPPIWRWLVRKRLARFVRASLPPEGPYICNVEIGPESVRVGQESQEASYRWRDIVEIVEREDAVEMLTGDGGGVVVAKSAFATDAERERFIEQARGYREAAIEEG